MNPKNVRRVGEAGPNQNAGQDVVIGFEKKSLMSASRT